MLEEYHVVGGWWLSGAVEACQVAMAGLEFAIPSWPSPPHLPPPTPAFVVRTFILSPGCCGLHPPSHL